MCVANLCCCCYCCIIQERWRQAFGFYDKEKRGYITGDQFITIIRNVNDGKLAHDVKERLANMAGLVGERKISYAEY